MEEAAQGHALADVGGPFAAAYFLSTLAVASALAGQDERALACAREAVATTRRGPLPGMLAMALARGLAATACAGRWTEAEELLREQVVLLRRLGTRRWTGETLEFAALILEATGRTGAAALALEAAAGNRRAANEPLAGGIPHVVERLEGCRRRLGVTAESDPKSVAAAAPAIDATLLDVLQALDAELPDRAALVDAHRE